MDPNESGNLPDSAGGSHRGSVSSTVARNPAILVYLANDTVVQLLVENLGCITAGELSRMVRESLQLPDQAQEIFSLWLISPFLELQLKPKHLPYKLCRQWPDLLYRFTNCSADDIIQDEPSLQFRRNVFFPKVRELQVENDRILRLLYEEAKANILEGRYPCDMEDCRQLGAIACRVELGPFDQAQHTHNFFRDKLALFLPAHLCKKAGGFLAAFRGRGGKQHGHEEELREAYQQLTDGAACEEAEAVKHHHKEYLQRCHLLPYYGCAVFSGEIDRLPQGFLHRGSRKPVNIGISVGGVSIMDSKEKHVLVALAFHELSWDHTRSEDEDGEDMLLLEFDGEEEGGAMVNKLLKIYSKQAELMSGMIEYCIDFNSAFEPPVAEPGAAKPPLARPREKRGKLKRQNSVVANRIQQLSTIDYVEEGKEIKRVKPKRAASFFTRQLSQGPTAYTAVEVTETLEC
uniref:FERM domain-containing protein 8 n=1 Tax=Callorhinchus milii TaxID=7868 RepID=A0A4W3IUB3_CALMI|eukprot:gi/632986743/ref/XP_007910407.1/ PREDICTED: LOW QUALITY PROTEIN: FERM domain-containing protein 8 [Callorhinchus milii]